MSFLFLCRPVTRTIASTYHTHLIPCIFFSIDCVDFFQTTIAKLSINKPQ